MRPPAPAAHTWLVECFAPGIRPDGLAAIGDEAAAAVARLQAGGAPIEYLGATLVPDDEVVLLHYRGPTAEAVRGATDRLSIECGRVVESVDVGPAQDAVDPS
jgi:hypothetical protein